ncbi:MAG TPA: chromosome segregation protein SMC [Actinobacteria bacterium]|nr:chromosome segregation protein SMC [Actinomycetota bacterium]
MRPLRLLLDGFGCYRQRTDVDLSDVEFFALVGPTGAGKSTLIDGLCFALYGTVPRWGKENVIAQALAPAANACRVCLVFEVAGKRYGIARALTRGRGGQVTTKEARLDLLDPAIEPGAQIEDLLEAVAEPVAEGPDEVRSRVEAILGLSYKHFTQSVLLPQGRFAEFLNATPGDRQKLLVELLAFSIYRMVGEAARERAKRATDRKQNAESQRLELADATPEAEAAADARVTELADLTGTVQERLTALAGLRQRAQDTAAEAEQVRTECAKLAAVRTPADVPDLARRIAEAERLVAERQTQRDAAESAETAAQQAREALGDKTELELFRKAYSDRRDLTARLKQQEQAHVARTAKLEQAAAEVGGADDRLRRAREALVRAERAHAAVALAEGLRVGDDCPVCLRPVTGLPHHPAVADLDEAGAAIEAAEERRGQAQAAHQKAVKLASDTESAVKAIQGRLDEIAATLTEAPGEADVARSLEAISTADKGLGNARQDTQAARKALADAGRQRADLGKAEGKARAGLARSRDTVVALGAPEMGNADLAADWNTLTEWARRELEERQARQPGLDTAAAHALAEVEKAGTALMSLLAEHGVDGAAGPGGAAAAVATHAERARGRLASIRANLETAARLDGHITALAEEEQVATMLGNLLRSDKFERWLCGEALDLLVTEASEVLMGLSSRQYELDRDERNDLVVVDYQDAAAERPVHTLSGGETFQASLALALALSRQVAGLSAGQREMNSMFLDEGFGTLDENTLETVGTTLEQLAADSDRMIGIITHVPALAERAPVRFVVSKTGTGSTLRKERP